MKDPLGQLRLRFAGLRLVQERRHGQVYAGKDFSGNDVTVVVLSEDAAADAELRGAFTEAVRQQQRPTGSGAAAVHAADVHAAQPWAATKEPSGLAIAERLVSAVGGRSGPGALPSDPLSAADPVPAANLLPRSGPPQFSVALPLSDALSLVDPPAPVRPDPLFASADPPPRAAPPATPPGAAGGQAQSPPGPPASGSPPVRPASGSPPVRPRPAAAHRPRVAPPRGPAAGSPAGPPSRKPASSGTPTSVIVAGVVIGVMLLMVCCSAVAASF